MSMEVHIERKYMDVCACGTMGFYNVLFPIKYTLHAEYTGRLYDTCSVCKVKAVVK